MTAPHLPSLPQRLAVRTRPSARPVMHQTWERLLFLHWRVEPAVLQQRLPPGLFLDTFDRSAWVGIVPFFMRNVRICGLPPLPTTVHFLELNLRTYVHDEDGLPGVWFFSLDASSRLAVWGARWWFGLPYHAAAMSATVEEATGRVDYHARRRGTPVETASRFVYAPAGELREAAPDSLEFFLIERYVLFAPRRRGGLAIGRVHHPPYQYAAAEVSVWDDRLLELEGLSRLHRPPDHAVVSPGVRVEVFGLEPLPL